MFMKTTQSIDWQNSYAALPAQYRTHLDRYHLEVAGHRNTDGYPMFGWRPGVVPNVTWGDDRCRAITVTSTYEGIGCTTEEWAQRTDVVLQASEYSTFNAYTDQAVVGAWAIMKYLLSVDYLNTTNPPRTIIKPPGDDPMAFYSIVSKKTGGVASTFNEAVYDYGIRGLFETSAHIGSPSLAGNATHWDCVYNISGAGSGLSGTSDRFRYLYKSCTNNGTLVARIDQFGGPSAQACAGLMVRAGTGADAPFVFIGAKTNNTLSFTYRSTAGAASVEKTIATVGWPCWVRLTRRGNLFIADYSTNGFDWERAGTRVVSGISLAGLAVCSGSSSLYSARLSNVSETFTAPAVNAFNPASYSVLFTQNFSGLGLGLQPGTAYTTAALNADRSINTALISSVSGLFKTGTLPGLLSPAVVAPGNVGLSPSAPDGYENEFSFAPRVSPQYALGMASAGKVFRMAYAEITVSGVTKDGFQASIGYQLADGSTQFLHFNEGKPVTNGTHRVDLRPANLIWTNTSTPLSSGNSFRPILTDAGREDLQLGVTDGTLESFKVYAETGPFPAAPTLLTAVPGDKSVQLNWSGSSPAGCRVYRRMPDSYGSLQIGQVTGNTFTDTTAFNGIAYSYMVRAVGASGEESDNSNKVTVTPTESLPPAAPTMLTVTMDSGFVRLDWADNTEADLGGYNVYRRNSGTSTYTLIASNVTRSVYLDQTAVVAMTDLYKVTALDRLGNESE